MAGRVSSCQPAHFLSNVFLLLPSSFHLLRSKLHLFPHLDDGELSSAHMTVRTQIMVGIWNRPSKHRGLGELVK